MSRLDGKVAIVTRAGSGIGRATVELLAKRGAAVVVADINQSAAEAVAAGIRERGQQALAVAADVSDESQIQQMIEDTVSTFGGVDIVHNNAALLSPDVIARDTQVTAIEAASSTRCYGSTSSATHSPRST